MFKTETLTSYRDLTVGDRVEVPGHRRSDPTIIGTLELIERTQRARSVGITVTIRRDDGRPVFTAIGLVSKA